MSGRREVWSRAVTSALEASAVAVAQMAPGHWAFAPGNTPAMRASAWLSDDWLLFDAPLPEFTAPVLEQQLFAANARFASGLKFCIADREPGLRLRAEVPLLEDVPAVRCVHQVCGGLAAAVAWLESRRRDGLSALSSPPPLTDSDVTEAAEIELPQRCRDTHWPFTVRGPDAVMVELDVPGAFQQATVEVQPRGGVVVSLPVIADPPCSPV